MLDGVVCVVIAIGTWENNDGELHGLTPYFGDELNFGKDRINAKTFFEWTLINDGAARVVNGYGNIFGRMLVATQRFNQLEDHFIECVNIVVVQDERPRGIYLCFGKECRLKLGVTMFCIA